LRLEILLDDDPGLRGVSEEVKEVTPELKKFALDMATTMAYNNGVGLAAPQVGKKIRLIVFDTTFAEDDGKLGIMFNPEVINKSGEIQIAEGCLSLPGRQTVVKRARSIRVSYMNSDGHKGYTDLDGVAAIVVQHEIDHLNGVLMIDYERQ
jgi:peptide deformylase